MATEHEFTRRNVVRDENMMTAFREGFVEGAAMALEQPVYEVTVEFEGTQINRMTLHNERTAVEAVAQAIKTPGVKVTVEVGVESSGSAQGEITAPADDEVVEGEVVD